MNLNFIELLKFCNVLESGTALMAAISSHKQWKG